MLGGVPDSFSEMVREDALHGHDVRAEAGGLEVIAFAGPLIALEGDAMAAVVAAESDVEAFEGDPVRLFGVALRLLDLGDETRVHELLHHPSVPAGAGHGDSMPGTILVA